MWSTRSSFLVHGIVLASKYEKMILVRLDKTLEIQLLENLNITTTRKNVTDNGYTMYDQLWLLSDLEKFEQILAPTMSFLMAFSIDLFWRPSTEESFKECSIGASVLLGSKRFWEAIRKRVVAFGRSNTEDGKKKQMRLQSIREQCKQFKR